MLPRNPFDTTYAEMVDSSETFTALFDHTVIDTKTADDTPFISEEMFERIVFFSSSPGGGKSSIFHFFSPDVLNCIVQSQKQNPDSYAFLEELGVIVSNSVRLLGIQISCARNYEIIEDIYENGISTQIFFALLNVRILKEALKSILALKKTDGRDLDRISFVDIPAELSAVFDANWTGKDFYTWACEEEKKICASINNMESSQPVAFIHNYLSIIQLFESTKVLYDGKQVVDKVLFMLDDIHKLTIQQRSVLRESLFTVRARVGVWLAQRSYALDENELLGKDGISGRDYISRKLEDQREGGRTKSFYKTLESIADRRVKANTSIDINSFSSCISDRIDWSLDKDSYKKLCAAYDNLQEEILKYVSLNEETYYNSDSHIDLFEKTITLRAVKILIDRKLNNQQLAISDYFLAPAEDELYKVICDNTLRSIAEYYLCIENSLPFYYGKDKLFLLSFNNVYQFLSCCGQIFERRLSYKYASKKRHITTVSPLEQDRILSKLAKKRWDELDVMYSNSRQIKLLLENIASMGILTREIGTASYSGGAYTGIGIRDPLLNSIISEEKYSAVKSLLATCVSGNLLRMKAGKQGSKDEPVTVFYLNRWICVHFKLPLAYGGWKPCNMELLNKICTEQIESLNSNLHYTNGGFLNE